MLKELRNDTNHGWRGRKRSKKTHAELQTNLHKSLGYSPTREETVRRRVCQDEVKKAVENLVGKPEDKCR